MRFYQKHTVNESDHGEQSVLFVVSDVYSELIAPLNENDIEVNIIGLDTVKKDLNGENGTFAIDEMGFSINELACDSPAELNCLQFILKATNVNVIRYCSVYFGDAVAIDDRIFHGKIGEKVSGDDKVWEGEEFDYEVRPKREYKFNAYAFDISILEKVKMTEQMEDENGDAVLPVYEYFTDFNLTTLLYPHMALYPSYCSDPTGTDNAPLLLYNCPLIDLKSALDFYLLITQLIIEHLTGSELTFSIKNSDIGITGSPMTITVFDTESTNIRTTTFAIENASVRALHGPSTNYKKLELKPHDELSDLLDSSPIYIHRRMIDPSFGLVDFGNTDDIEEWRKTQIAAEKPFSFKNFDNIAELLYAVARALGCYVRVVPNNNGTDYEITFESITNVKESNITYVKGVNSANIDLSSNVNDKTTEYYSVSNNIAADGLDNIKELPGDELATKANLAVYTQIKLKEENQKIESKQLLFSASTTLQIFDYQAFYLVQLMNITDEIPTGALMSKKELRHPYYGNTTQGRIPDMFERLHSSLYIKLQAPEEIQQQNLLIVNENDTVLRPLACVHYNYDGVDKSGSLADYINMINQNAKQYYESEYTLKIPYWNAFSKSPNGADSSWRNVRLGSVIKLTDSIQVWHDPIGETAGYWSTEDVERDYMVTSIEINLKQPETTLKLQNSSLAAYGDYQGTDDITPQSMIMTSEIPVDPLKVAYYEIDNPPFLVPAYRVNAGDAVMLLANGKITKSVSKQAYYGKTRGIALVGGEYGDSIPVQFAGEVFCESYNFANIGFNVFARTEWVDPNIFQSLPMDMPNADEDLIIQLGAITGPNSFMLNLRNWIVR